jgi:hypothetical protein
MSKVKGREEEIVSGKGERLKTKEKWHEVANPFL